MHIFIIRDVDSDIIPTIMMPEKHRVTQRISQWLKTTYKKTGI